MRDKTFQGFAADVLGLLGIFSKLSFERRARGLAKLSESLAKEPDAEIRRDAFRFLSVFLDRHIKLVSADVRKKYGIESRRANFNDFERICRGENIAVQRSSYSQYFVDENNQVYIVFDDSFKGVLKLREVFGLLGNHFLHRSELMPSKTIRGIFEPNSHQKTQGLIFASYIAEHTNGGFSD